MNTLYALDQLLPEETVSLFKAVEVEFERVSYSGHVFELESQVVRENFTLTEIRDAATDVYSEGIRQAVLGFGVRLNEEEEIPLQKLLEVLRGTIGIVYQDNFDLVNAITDETSDIDIYALWVGVLNGKSSYEYDSVFSYVPAAIISRIIDHAEENSSDDGSLKGTIIKNMRALYQSGFKAPVAVGIVEGDTLLPMAEESLWSSLGSLVTYEDPLAAAEEWVGLCLLTGKNIHGAKEMAVELLSRNLMRTFTITMIHHIEKEGLSDEAL